MSLDNAVLQIALLIAEKTDKSVELNESFKASLKNYLRDLLTLLGTPEETSAQQEILTVVIQQLGEIYNHFNKSGFKFTPETFQTISILCGQAPQIAAMRGLIQHKEGFNNDIYRPMYNRHFQNDHEPDIWGCDIVFQFELLGLNNTLIDFHYRIVNQDFIHIDVSNNFIQEKNVYGETALDLALRYNKPDIVSTLRLYILVPLFADKMMSLLDTSRCFDEKISHKDLSTFIHSLFSEQMILQSQEYPDHSHDKEYRIKPRTSAGLINLKYYDQTSHEFTGQLDCATSEMEETFETLVTILNKLKQTSVQYTFLYDNTFCRASKPFTPAILCTLSFLIASTLGGHHSNDFAIDMKQLARLHQYAFKDDISHIDLKQWEYRTLIMLEFFKPISLAQGDQADEEFDNSDYEEINAVKLREWVALHPHTRPAASYSFWNSGNSGQSSSKTAKKCVIQ